MDVSADKVITTQLFCLILHSFLFRKHAGIQLGKKCFLAQVMFFHKVALIYSMHHALLEFPAFCTQTAEVTVEIQVSPEHSIKVFKTGFK